MLLVFVLASVFRTVYYYIGAVFFASDEVNIRKAAKLGVAGAFAGSFAVWLPFTGIFMVLIDRQLIHSYFKPDNHRETLGIYFGPVLLFLPVLIVVPFLSTAPELVINAEDQSIYNRTSSFSGETVDLKGIPVVANDEVTDNMDGAYFYLNTEDYRMPVRSCNYRKNISAKWNSSRGMDERVEGLKVTGEVRSTEICTCTYKMSSYQGGDYWVRENLDMDKRGDRLRASWNEDVIPADRCATRYLHKDRAVDSKCVEGSRKQKYYMTCNSASAYDLPSGLIKWKKLPFL